MTSVTKQTIEAAWRKRFDGGERTVKVVQVPGLDCIIYDDYAIWRLDYKLPGVNPETGKRWSGKKGLLGRLAPDFHLPEAIHLAREWKVKVAKGIDPAGEQKAALSAQLVETAAAGRTMRSLVEAYKAARSPRWRPSTVKAFAVDLRDITDALGDALVTKVTRKELAAFLRNFVDRKVAEGHRGTRVERLRMLLGSLFAFAVEREWLELSPAQRLPLPAKSQDRARVLDGEEIAQTWGALSQRQAGIGEGLRLALKISLVTGQRIGACALAREPDLDLDGHDDVDLADSGPRWLIRGEPGAKATRDRVVPLSLLAVAVFREALALPGREPGGYVFRGQRSGLGLAQESISHAWGVLRRAGKVPPDTTPHDLRRTARTWWPELAHGQEEHILERILGHAVGTKVQRTYDRALWLPQQRRPCWRRGAGSSRPSPRAAPRSYRCPRSPSMPERTEHRRGSA